MFYINVEKLNTSKETFTFKFNHNNITYISNDNEINGELYTPSNSDIEILKNEYIKWCEKFNQVQNEVFLEDVENLNKYKLIKLGEVKEKSDSFRSQLINKEMFVTSSLGFEVDADKDSQDNVTGQINLLTATKAPTIKFKDKNNVLHDLNLEQLQTLLIEMQTNGANLFNQKWAFEQAINDAQTFDDLNSIDINFKMLKFPFSN